MAEEQNKAKLPLFFGMYPAATKKTGSYVDPPMFEPMDKREDESWVEYYARKKEERKRKPRPRKKTGGWCFAFPDVCFIPGDPPIPFPFPNWGMLADAVMCATTVKVEGKPIVVETSEIPNTKGDEFGTNGGVLSGTFTDKVNFLEYSSKIFVEGKAIVYLTCKTAQNNYNTLGKFVKPAQKKVWVTP